MQFLFDQSFRYQVVGPPVRKPGNRIEIPLDVRTMPQLGLSKLPLAFASLLIAFPTRHKHQPFHSDSKEGDRAIIYLTDCTNPESGIVQFKDKKIVGRAGTGVFYKASTIHRGRANRSQKIRIALALAYSTSRVITVGGGLLADDISATFSGDLRTVSGTFTFNSISGFYSVYPGFFYSYNTVTELVVQEAFSISGPYRNSTLNYLGNIQNNSSGSPTDIILTFAVANVTSLHIEIYTNAGSDWIAQFESPFSGENIAVNSGIATVTSDTGTLTPGITYTLVIDTEFSDGTGKQEYFEFDLASLNSSVLLSSIRVSSTIKYEFPGSFGYAATFTTPLTYPNETIKFVGFGRTSTNNFGTPLKQNMRQTALANIYGRLGEVEFDLTSQSLSLSDLAALGTSYSASFTSFDGSFTDIGTTLSSLATTDSSFSTVIEALQISISSIAVGGGVGDGSIGGGGTGGGSVTVLSLLPSTFNLKAVNGYDYLADDPYFPAQPVPFYDQTFLSSSLFRPFQLDLDDHHFLSTSAYFKNNSLLVAAPLHTPITEGQRSNSNYIVLDPSRFSVTTGTTLRMYNAQEVTDDKIATYTLMSAQPFFSYTGCSYSINDIAPTRGFSHSCGALAQSLSMDSSTIYVYGAYESNTSNSTLLYWAQVPLASDASFSPLRLQPEQLSCFKSDTLLITESPYDPLNEWQRFVPLIPGEDWYELAAANSVSQFQSATGFGCWPTRTGGGNQLSSFTGLSYIGFYDTLRSYSNFNPQVGEFFVRATDASFSNNSSDNIFFCATAGGETTHSCSAIASIVSEDGYSSFTVDLSSVNNFQLHSTYGLVRGADAWASITERLSISTAENIFSLSLDTQSFASNTLTPVYDSLVRGGLLKGVAISEIQPQENLSLVYNASTTYWANPPYYWRIPSVLNPSNIQFNPIFSTTVLSVTEVLLPGSASAAAGGFYNQVRANLEPGIFSTDPPGTISFQFNVPFQTFSSSTGAILTTITSSPTAIDFVVSIFDPAPTYYVDFYFPKYYTEINVSYSTISLGGGW